MQTLCRKVKKYAMQIKNQTSIVKKCGVQPRKLSHPRCGRGLIEKGSAQMRTVGIEFEMDQRDRVGA